MSVRFKSITVVPHFEPAPTGGFDVFWEIEGNDFTPTFKVLYADTESGPAWEQALAPVEANAGTDTGDTHVTDTGDTLTFVVADETTDPTPNSYVLNVTPQILNMQALRWFKVQVFNGSQLVKESWAVDHRQRLNKPDYLMFREHLRRARLTLIKKTGTPGILIRRRIHGATCSNCCDEIHGTPVSQECSVCYGTGIVGGYYPPVPMLADWGREGPPRVTNTTEDPGGPTQVVKSQIHAFPIPDAKSEDIWIDLGTRYRYVIERNDATPFKGSVMWQVLTLSRLPAHHPAYRFPLP